VADSWKGIQTQGSRSYICGYCDHPLAAVLGWQTEVPATRATQRRYIYVCHHCGKPTFFAAEGKQTPGAKLGAPVGDISEKSVESLYDEARQSTTAGAYTAAVLACRKLLMHIAVAKGAKAGAKFIEYVEFLAANNYVPPDAKPWVDHIREKGNEANHEISIMTKEDAEELLAFCEMLLKLVFEFPAIMKRKYPQPAKP
jgi:hypothetical protein